jgi:hypothetical protein
MARIIDLKEKMRLTALRCPSLDLDSKSLTVLLLHFFGICGPNARVIKMCSRWILMLMYYESSAVAVKR